MLLVYYVLAIILLWISLSFWQSSSRKRDVGDTPSIKMSMWVSLKLAVGMLFYDPLVPSYEISDIVHKQIGKTVGIMDMIVSKYALMTVADLAWAKRIMSSAGWINRFRDDYYMFKCTFGKPYGLLFGGGEYWRQARALTLRILHQLDFYNQDNLESMISYEINEVENELRAKLAQGGGQATFSPHQMFEVPAFNMISRMGWSARFSHQSKVLADIFDSSNEMNRTFNVGFGVLEVLPWLSNFPSLSFYGPYKKANELVIEFFMNILKERRQSQNYKLNPMDFTDYFLLEIDKRDEHESQYINDEAYCLVMRDMVWAGTDTTNSALEHGILQMSLRPSIQAKVRAEIDDVIGRQMVPTYADRVRMNYTQAVLLEILRYSCPVPLTSRSCLQDTEIGVDTLPKGSLCGINIYAIHRSTELWEDPEEFRPERFLGPNGEIINSDKIIPFGFGKRLCIGEAVARTFLFMAFVSLMQKFEFELSKSHPPPSLRNNLGISRCPIPYHVTIKARPDI